LYIRWWLLCCLKCVVCRKDLESKVGPLVHVTLPERVSRAAICSGCAVLWVETHALLQLLLPGRRHLLLQPPSHLG
jgi:hypothetical protein